MAETVEVAFAALHPEATLPRRMTSQAAGLDLCACLGEGQQRVLAVGERTLVPTGLQVMLPEGHEGQVRPRSGLALRDGVTVLNSPGTIDADYRGEIGIVLVNLGQRPVTIEHGDRVAQLVVAPVTMAIPVAVEPQPPGSTDRGSGGYGSTGGR